MKIDHLVIGVDNKYQNDREIVASLNRFGYSYDSKKGKKNKGFKVTNLWLNKEYLELFSLRNSDGGGWIKEWCHRYNNNERGLYTIIFDVEDINEVYNSLLGQDVIISKPEAYSFRYLFMNLKVPWKNSYVAKFKGLPLQIAFQQLSSEKIRERAEKRMKPNSNIKGIKHLKVFGDYLEEDLVIINKIFSKYLSNNNSFIIDNNQMISFIKDREYHVEVECLCNNEFVGAKVRIENIDLINV